MTSTNNSFRAPPRLHKFDQPKLVLFTREQLDLVTQEASRLHASQNAVIRAALERWFDTPQRERTLDP